MWSSSVVVELSLAISGAAPRLRGDWQIRSPRAEAAHQTPDPLRGAEAEWGPGDDFVVHMKPARIPRGLDAVHRLDQQVARDPAHGVLGPGVAVEAVAVATFAPLAERVVHEH